MTTEVKILLENSIWKSNKTHEIRPYGITHFNYALYYIYNVIIIF